VAHILTVHRHLSRTARNRVDILTILTMTLAVVATRARGADISLTSIGAITSEIASHATALFSLEEVVASRSIGTLRARH